MTITIGNLALMRGDSREVLRGFPDNIFDSVVTDPPYALVSIVKRFGSPNAAPAKGDVYARASAGFMGQQWDTGETAFAVEFWAEVMRVLKPGGYVLAASGTRTYHRLAVAIEDAGFEIRDMISWLYGSGFPKSHDVSKGIDARMGVKGSVIATGNPVARMIPGADQNQTGSWIKDNGRTYQPGQYEPATPEAAQWEGWGTALKPACEPWVMARKPLIGTVADNVLVHGTGAINIDGCRVGENGSRTNSSQPRANRNGFVKGFVTGTSTTIREQGRWPSNVIHDGSEEVTGLFPANAGAASPVKGTEQSAVTGEIYHERGRVPGAFHGDKGSAARFFYAAKASKSDRGPHNKHPTVKPTDLMQYLCRLVTPPGGMILDPFMGSGSTGKAAHNEGFGFVGIERQQDYYEMSIARLAEHVWK